MNSCVYAGAYHVRMCLPCAIVNILMVHCTLVFVCSVMHVPLYALSMIVSCVMMSQLVLYACSDLEFWREIISCLELQFGSASTSVKCSKSVIAVSGTN